MQAAARSSEHASINDTVSQSVFPPARAVGRVIFSGRGIYCRTLRGYLPAPLRDGKTCPPPQRCRACSISSAGRGWPPSCRRPPSYWDLPRSSSASASPASDTNNSPAVPGLKRAQKENELSAPLSRNIRRGFHSLRLRMDGLTRPGSFRLPAWDRFPRLDQRVIPYNTSHYCASRRSFSEAGCTLSIPGRNHHALWEVR